ncbi:MAG: cytochrome c [Leptothrix sp. (in: b-proteobacteria)]
MRAINFRPLRLLAVLLGGWLATGACLAADPTIGARLYASHCAACHGARGAPLMPGAPDFRRIETLLRPDGQLLRSIRNGQRAMPAYFGVLKDSEILDVIAHLRTLN